ncbi:hypothetical protein NESM_000878200 [Novymonas esmeraldas]|uniref:Uncharacterized protein n=1 Tax=Novymonas esmeraldas TaxID=1808958 RepID=A0AAW0F1H5_9TRYP
MFGRRANWQAVLCLRPPRSLARRSSAAPTPAPASTPAHTSHDTAAAPAPLTHAPPPPPLRLPTCAPHEHLSPHASSTVVLAAPSANVLATARRSGSAAVVAHETLTQALGTRDAYRVYCALLREQWTASASTAATTGELEALLCNAEEEAASLATVVCACVAVTLSPADWPPWLSARFVTTGTAVVPVTPTSSPSISRGEAARGGGVSTSGSRDDWVAASPLRVAAAAVLRRIAARLRAQDACDPSTSARLPLLRWLVLLCGVALAPTSQSAVHLATEASRASLDAAGVALAAFCASHDRAAAVPAAAVEDSGSRELRWLSLWTLLTHPRAQPPSPPPFSLHTVVASPAVVAWADGLAPAALQERRLSWHLHCLVASRDAHSAARLLAGVYRDASHPASAVAAAAAAATSEEEGVCRSAVIPVLVPTQAELLACLPAPLLDEDGLGERLAHSLVSHLRDSSPPPRPSSSRGPSRSPAFVPAVTANAAVYARMLRYLVATRAQARSEVDYARHLHDLTLLLSHGATHALAASLVPADQPLTSVMVAATDPHRQDRARQLVSAVREVVEALCEEPVPGLAVTALASAQSEESSGAASWRWRERVLADVDATVQAATGLLASLLELSSARRSSLPLRTAEPRWRRELRERTAVRAHKFELLLQELPHTELRAVLQALLSHGYTREGGLLGLSLVKGDQVDLRYYTLPLLGSLYLALSAPAPTPATATAPPSCASAAGSSAGETGRQAVYRMYRRRLEIYGVADHTGCGDGATRSPAQTAPTLVHRPEGELAQALVLASTRSPTSIASYETAELANCLLNRRVEAAGHGMVVDVGSSCRVRRVFGAWIRTGVATV